MKIRFVFIALVLGCSQALAQNLSFPIGPGSGGAGGGGGTSSLTVNSTPVSGGSAGNLLYTDGTLLQATANVVYSAAANNAILALSGGSLTGSSTNSFLSITGTWNTTGVVDAALLVNVTNTASGTGSLLLDLQAGG